jgi:VWFA-related protein
MRSTIRTLVCAIVVAGAAADAGRAQQKPAGQTQDPAPDQRRREQQRQDQPADQARPVFRSGINFVRVDVIVSDKNGNNVGDLKPTDFEVTEGGKVQTIEAFKLIELSNGAADPDGPPRPIRTDFDEEREAARDDVRLFAIFLDDYHVRRNNSVGVRDPLSRFIDTQLRPSDMIGVMYPLESLSAVRMTRDREAVIGAIQQFAGRKYDYTPRNELEERYAYYPTETVERIRNKVSLSAIKGLIIHLGSLKEGRKALILVSEGYTYMVPPQMRNPVAMAGGLSNPNAQVAANSVGEDRLNFSLTSEMQLDLKDIFDEANRQNVSIYTVDPRGLAVSEFDISEPNVGMQTDRQYLTATVDTLRQLAEQTDGHAIVNQNDLALGMKQIVRDTSAYYLLGYSSTEAPQDGKFHEVKVRVKRPGVHVRSRKGYWAFTADDAARATAPPKPGLPPAAEAALATAVTPSRFRLVRTWIGTSRGENGKTRLTVVWEPVPKLPGDRPTLPGDEPARMAIMALGTDGSPYFRGRVPDVALASTSPSTASVGASGAPRTPSRVTFDVKPGKVQLRLSVEGGAAQILDSEVREIAVPDLTAPQTSLGTPLLFHARTARDFQLIKDDPQAVPTATRDFSRTERLLIRVPAYGAAPPTTKVRLLNRAGQAMMELNTGPDGRSGLPQTELPLAGLAPGEYLLEVKAAGEGGEAQELIGFRVTS